MALHERLLLQASNISMPSGRSHMIQSSFFSISTLIALCVFFALLCACILVGHLLEGNRWANESIISLLMGLCAGGVVLLVTGGRSSKLLVFSEDLFFLYLLPPIIFNAGFQVKKKQFFKNFTVILLFGVLGTVISFVVISAAAVLIFSNFGFSSLTIQDYLAIGAIMSATDSVCTLQVLSQDETPFLYSVVFGEGVVNDATSIVLFSAIQSLDIDDLEGITFLKLFGKFLFLFCTSTILGVLFGLATAFIIKVLYFGRHSTDREVALMLLMAYLSYLLSELMNLSGILTVFFCGIVMSHYTWHNVTESSRITTKHAFATISFISETFIFLYVGIDALNIDNWEGSKASVGTSIAISSIMFGFVLVGRAAFVFPLVNIYSYIQTRDINKIEFRQQFVMWWAGLMRGAVTIALTYNQFSRAGDVVTTSESDLIITCTIIVVLFSTIVFGSITKPLIETLVLQNMRSMTSEGVDIASLEDLRLLFLENDAGESSNHSPTPKPGSLRLLMTHPTSTVHYWWRKFDDRFMRPMFGGRGFVPYVPASPSGAGDASASTFD